MSLRVVFMGSPDFAVPGLVSLVEDPDITVPLVVTQPDRPAGRGRKLSFPAVKVTALENDLELFQPESLRGVDSIQRIASVEPDLIMVSAYGEILKQNILELPSHGVLNVHPSLLPRFRGAAPVRAAILADDAETGVSVIKLVRRLDAGPILAQRRVALSGHERADELECELAELAAKMLPELCKSWTRGTIEPRSQSENDASYTHEWTRDDARIGWDNSALEIDRLVRASQPWPVAWSTFQDDPFRIHAVRVVNADPGRSIPGTVYRSGKSLLAATGAGVLELLAVQPAGKKPMQALDWWNGVRAKSVVLG